MKQFLVDSAYFGVVISLAGYEAGLWLRRITKKSFVKPLLIAVVLVMAALLLLGVDGRCQSITIIAFGIPFSWRFICLMI